MRTQPALHTGATLGTYEILSLIGAGGMGEVYRARDRRLNREVAIKVLPADRIDEDRRRRFVQEAQAASALNHPNIVTIYGIDDAGGVDFIAMELIAGDSLDRMIPPKGLPLTMLLRHAVQIASALSAAHAAGIVHRDVKPSNVMVTHSGLVKVLDFGLAKLSERAASPGTAAPETVLSESKPNTAEGMILGTLSYMSPEQAEGRPVDCRSDVFSFGAVLYEMVTGRRAFHGDTPLSTLSAILRDEPKSASQIVHDVPNELERVIARCLRKEASRRFQHMDDVKVALEELKEESESGKLLAPSSVAQLAPARTRVRRLVWAGMLSVLVLGAITAWFLRPSAVVSPATDFEAAPLSTYPGFEDSPSFSPDGTQVAFSWNGVNQDNQDIYVKLVGPGPPPLRLTSDAAADSVPTWSPDGRFIAFQRAVGVGRLAVLLVAPIGGPERSVGEVTSRHIRLSPSAMAWTPDSQALLVIDQEAGDGAEEGVFLLPVSGPEKRRLTSPPRGSWDASPALSPDGKTLTFSRITGQASRGIFVVPLSSDFRPQGAPKTLMPDSFPFGLAWTADGRDVITVAGANSGMVTRSLWRVAADGSGAPQRLSAANDCSSPSVSARGGRLAYACQTTDSSVWRIDVNGAPTTGHRLISSTRQEHSAQFSPDGTRVAFYSTRSGTPEIWVCNRDGTGAMQVTSLGGPPCGTPRWAPDGKRIVFDANMAGQWDVFVVGASGGSPSGLTNVASFEAAPSWSHDGKWIYFCSDRSGTREIWRMAVQGGEAMQVTRKGGFAALESRDGQSVYYTKSDEGTEGLWTVPVSGGQEILLLDSVVPNRGFAVADEGIYFVTGTGPYTLEFLGIPNGQRKKITAIEDHIIYLSVSPDAKSILYSRNEQAGSDLMLIENFK